RRARLQRRGERLVQGVRCEDRQGALEIQLRRRCQCTSGLVHGGRQAVRRRGRRREQPDRREARQQRLRFRDSVRGASLRIGPPAVALLAAAGWLLAAPAAAAADDAATRQLAQQCFACHGEDGNSTNPRYPILAGQSWRYIYIELKDFKEGRRSNAEMSPMAAPLTREQMMALGNFFAAQKPKPIAFTADA